MAFVLPVPPEPRESKFKLEFWKLLRALTFMLAAFALWFSLQNRAPDTISCAPADATPIAIPVRSVDANVPDLDQRLVAEFNKHEGIWIRDFFGCKEHETDPKKCIWEAGGINGPEWKQARELAKQVYGLAEPRKPRFQ